MMSDTNDIYWSKEHNHEVLSHVPGVDFCNKNVKFAAKKSLHRQGKHISKDCARNVSRETSEGCSTKPEAQVNNRNSSSMSKPHASLKDLCPEDKERVANLVRELAKAGQEKEASETKLLDEREMYKTKLQELQADKEKIEQEQKAILAEFQHCQTLLVCYQKRITAEQKEVARDINRLLLQSPINNRLPSSKEINASVPSPCNLDNDLDDEDIVVLEDEDGLSTQRSVRNSQRFDQEYHDVAGALGESFRHAERKLGPCNAADDTASDNVIVVGKKRSPLDENLETLPPSKADGFHRFSAFPFQHENVQLDLGKDFITDFDQRISIMSPNRRREALMMQKRRLQEEQQRLQNLVAEQEAILRARQKELRNRNLEHEKKVRYIKEFGRFPAAVKTVATEDSFESSDFDDSGQPARGFRANKDAFRYYSSETDRKPLWKMGSFRKQMLSDRLRAYSEPPKKNDSYRYRVDLTASSHRSESPSRQYKLYERSNRSKSVDDASSLNLSTTATGYSHSRFKDSTSPRQRNGGDRHHFYSKTYPSSGFNMDSTSRVYTSEDITEERPTVHATLATPRSLEIGSGLPEENRGRPASSTFATGMQSHFAQSILNGASSENELSTSSYNSPSRRLHNTMNNINSLTDLITSVENTYAPALSRPPAAALDSIRGTKHDQTSMAFDLDDSELLEDIFFIK